MLLCFRFGYAQNVSSPKFESKHLITGKIEIDGHIVKKEIHLKSTLEGIEIYDCDKKNYKLRKCDLKVCDIIHLELKDGYITTSGSIKFLPNYMYNTTTPNVILTDDILTTPIK